MSNLNFAELSVVMEQVAPLYRPEVAARLYYERQLEIERGYQVPFADQAAQYQGDLDRQAALVENLEGVAGDFANAPIPDDEGVCFALWAIAELTAWGTKLSAHKVWARYPGLSDYTYPFVVVRNEDDQDVFVGEWDDCVDYARGQKGLTVKRNR